jgi:hypothetical protein
LWCRRQWKSRQTRSSSALGRPKKLPPEWRSWWEVGIKNSGRKQRSENGKVTKKKNAKMMEENKRCFGLEETKRDVRARLERKLRRNKFKKKNEIMCHLHVIFTLESALFPDLTPIDYLLSMEYNCYTVQQFCEGFKDFILTILKHLLR